MHTEYHLTYTQTEVLLFLPIVKVSSIQQIVTVSAENQYNCTNLNFIVKLRTKQYLWLIAHITSKQLYAIDFLQGFHLHLW